MPTDKQLEELLDLMEQVEKGVKWGRIPTDEAIRCLTGINNKYPVQPNILPIPRATPFNPAEFIGQGWSIWKGPADGDGLSGNEDQDERSLALTELNLSKVQLVTCLKEDEASITGKERIRRLKETGHIRLDARIFQALWENKHFIPEAWKKKTNGYTTFIYFDGTPLRSPYGNRGVPDLYWDVGEWYWYYVWLGDVRFVSDPSVVLP